jgi:hypothetical protein
LQSQNNREESSTSFFSLNANGIQFTLKASLNRAKTKTLKNVNLEVEVVVSEPLSPYSYT